MKITTNTSILLALLTPCSPAADPKVKPAKVTVSDQVGKTIWKKSTESSLSLEQIWISAHRPATGIVTIIHERRDNAQGGYTTRVWATYDLAPGETIHLSGAIGSDTKIVIASETVPKGAVKVTATEQ